VRITSTPEQPVAGHATTINVVLYKDGSLSVEDDGRGMPVDIHPEEGCSGVEVVSKSKNFPSGINLTLVPVLRLPTVPITLSSVFLRPSEKLI
jgi:hypothetical protein